MPVNPASKIRNLFSISSQNYNKLFETKILILRKSGSVSFIDGLSIDVFHEERKYSSIDFYAEATF